TLTLSPGRGKPLTLTLSPGRGKLPSPGAGEGLGMRAFSRTLTLSPGRGKPLTLTLSPGRGKLPQGSTDRFGIALPLNSTKR
ncbi:MAG: hypothetical protein KJ063_24570, partial [Anaerolineae bacterium]|nr:hypothetical protein [Anaerolineae bacterium]